MHSLLARQLKRYFPHANPESEAWHDFVAAVDEAYRQSDADRLMLERSLDLSSQELMQANAEIRAKAKRELEASEEHYRALIENATDVITVLTASGEIRYTSPSIRRVMGFEPHELIGQNTFMYLHPDDMREVATRFAGVVSNPGTIDTVQYRVARKEGGWRTLESSGRAHLGPEGLLVIVNSRDVTDRLLAEEASRESADLFSKAFSASPVGISINDASTGEFLNANESFLRLFAYAEEQIQGRSDTDLDIWEDTHDRARFGELLAASGSVTNFETVLRTSEGDPLYCVISAELVELGGRRCLISITQDISERKQAEQTINHLAYHDSLTGLPNRALFLDRLNNVLARARRRGERVTVIFLDIDRFKLVNDTLGHAMGDTLLQSVASQLQQLLRDEDTIARIGGDEFTILLPDAGREQSLGVVDRVLERVKTPLSLAGREVRVTTSIGISQFPEDGFDAETLMRNADIAMYRAKEQGRDGYAFYNESLDPASEGRLALENDLRAAIERGEFVLHYQPQVRVDDGRIVGFEALVRWQHPERGLVPPAEFIPIAEETGLILPIGESVVRTACEQMKRWQERGLPKLPVAVNLSGYRFHRTNLVESISNVLRVTGLEPQYLHLEITEGVVIQDIERTVEILSELRGMGVQVSIDDFGTGYSSLSYLKRLPVDAVKIDRSFVSGLATDGNDAAIATAIIAMSHSIGLRVIAEGVETEEQLAFLRQRRCDFFQGFLVSPPLPAEEAEMFLVAEAAAMAR